MDDAELVRQARTCIYGTKQTDALLVEMADRIEALTKKRDETLAADTATLVFINADATPKNVRIICDRDSVPQIMAWYGAYFDGDRYTVALDGRNVRMDQNGEPINE